MKFLTILATVFCGGTVWVAADYYIEFRALPAMRSIHRDHVVTTFVYLCGGVPTGTRALAAGLSHCTPVSDREKANVYFDRNFYHVYKPNLRNHLIEFSDRSYTLRSEWNLGYFRHAIDHPNFGQPSDSAVRHFRDILVILGNDDVIPEYLVPSLANYFAQTNLMALYQNNGVANSFFDGFTNFLRGIMQRLTELSETPATGRHFYTLRTRLERAMKLGLQKMIDPCSVLKDNLRTLASNYCDTYCTFLAFASRHFNTAANRCSLEGGQCVGLLCTCNRVINNPFSGCVSGTSPMPLCHNYLREDLQN